MVSEEELRSTDKDEGPSTLQQPTRKSFLDRGGEFPKGEILLLILLRLRTPSPSSSLFRHSARRGRIGLTLFFSHVLSLL